MYPYGTWYKDFFVGLRSLLAAGVPVRSALETLASGGSGRAPRLARAALDRVEGGATLGEALSSLPIVPPEHAALVEAGERAGVLDRVLDRVVEWHEARRRAATDLLRGLARPLLILVMATLLLPLPLLVLGRSGTYLVVQVSVFVPLLAMAALSIFGLPARLRASALGDRLERLVLATPWVGALFRDRATGRFLGVLGILLETGASLETSLELASATLGWQGLRLAALEVPVRLRRGEKLHEALSAARELGLRPAWAARIQVAELSGTLGAGLLALGAEVEARIARDLGLAIRVLPAVPFVIAAAIVAVRALEVFGRIYSGGID